MREAAGSFLIIFGIICLLWGDANVDGKNKGGMVQRFFAISPEVAKLRKWLIGIFAILAGLGILLGF